MQFIISAATDTGITKEANQDSLAARVFSTPWGKIAFAVLCDGMGGLAKGEVASASLVRAFCAWAEERLPALSAGEIPDGVIRGDWTALAAEYNERIKQYGKRCGLTSGIGTTLTALLLTDTRYYIINVGDTRAYELAREPELLTHDQTVVAREVDQGLLTPEQAERDPRRSVLLQCIGASDAVYPDFFFGTTKKDAVYMLCSDGFRHEITPQEIYAGLNPGVMTNADGMRVNMEMLIGRNKRRMERDNISVITIRTF